MFRLNYIKLKFVQIILPEEDAVIHIDGDVVFLSPPEDLWSMFREWNPSQISGYAVGNSDPNTAHYTRNRVKFPFITKFGINSGIAPMNLTRMRQINYFKQIQTTFKTWQHKLGYFDQDLINIYFHDHPDRLFLLPCRFNYHLYDCRSKSFCEGAEKEGIAILHGTFDKFKENDNKMPPSKLVYQAFRD